MNRLGKIIFRCLSGTLLGLWILMAVLWVRGRFTVDEVYFSVDSHLMILGSFPNHGDVIFYFDADYHGPVVSVFLHDKQVKSQPEFWEVRVGGNSHRYELSVPWWLLMMIGLGFLISPASRLVTRRRRLKNGVCVNCGYDLRASRERCPECGMAIVRGVV